MAARRNMDRPTRLTEMLIKAVLSEKDGKSSEYELFMSAKRIAKIENLDKMTQLKSLNLAFNRLERIENLDKLRRLQQLQLYNNQITSCEGLASLTNLEILHLHGNKIAELGAELSGLRRLKQLRLDQNVICKLSSSCLTNCQRLISLDLSCNKIAAIKGAHVLPTSLETLNLSHNELTRIPACFKALGKLEDVNLGFNKLQSARALQANKRLSIVRLSKNRIADWGELPRGAMLSELYLDGNALAKVGRLDEALPMVDTLDLSNNDLQQITDLEPLCPQHSPALRELWLEGNPAFGAPASPPAPAGRKRSGGSKGRAMQSRYDSPTTSRKRPLTNLMRPPTATGARPTTSGGSMKMTSQEAMLVDMLSQLHALNGCATPASVVDRAEAQKNAVALSKATGKPARNGGRPRTQNGKAGAAAPPIPLMRTTNCSRYDSKMMGDGDIEKKAAQMRQRLQRFRKELTNLSPRQDPQKGVPQQLRRQPSSPPGSPPSGAPPRPAPSRRSREQRDAAEGIPARAEVRRRPNSTPTSMPHTARGGSGRLHGRLAAALTFSTNDVPEGGNAPQRGPADDAQSGDKGTRLQRPRSAPGASAREQQREEAEENLAPPKIEFKVVKQAERKSGGAVFRGGAARQSKEGKKSGFRPKFKRPPSMRGKKVAAPNSAAESLLLGSSF